MGKEWIETWTDDGGSEWESCIRVLDRGEANTDIPFPAGEQEQEGPAVAWSVKKWESTKDVPSEVATALGIEIKKKAAVETEADPSPSSMTAGMIPIEGAKTIKKADQEALSDALAQAWENVSQIRRENA